jgi:O-antigen ligase
MNAATKRAFLRRIPPNLLRPALGVLATLVTTGAGLLLGRALMSPGWAQAITLVGLGAACVLLVVAPAAGLLAWILLAPYAPHIHLSLELGSGIPNLDLTRIATVLLLFLLVSRTILSPRASPVPAQLTLGGLAGGRPVRLGLPEVLMGAFIVAMALSVLAVNSGLIAGIQNIFDFIAIPCLTYLFARNWLRGDRGIPALAATIALGCVLLSLIVVREQLTGLTVFSPAFYSLVYDRGIRKVMSLFGHPATLATALAVSIPLLVYGIQQARAASGRALLALALLATLTGVFFAYMRAGWLGAMLGLLVPILLSRKLRRAALPIVPLIAVAAVWIGTMVIQPEIVQGRLTSEDPITYRFTAWSIAWELFKTSPVLGIGWGQFGQIAAERFGWNPHVELKDLPSPHNTYLSLLTAGGLLALLPYLALLISWFVIGLRYWRRGIGREAVAALWATIVSFAAIIGSFDALNAQFANIVFFLIVGALVGHLEETAAAEASP